MTEEQAKTLYRQGEDDLVPFLMDIFRLEEQIAKNSGNSSKPPGSDGLSKAPLKPAPQSLRKKTARKPRGQTGRTGKTLLRVEQPDQIVSHRPSSRAHCEVSLREATGVTYSRRQVFEMPEPRIVVTEHRGLHVNCPCCGKENRGTFPAGVNHCVQ